MSFAANSHLVSAVRDGTAEGLTRYEVSAKALRFFRRHAGLFSENVGPSKRALQLYDYVRSGALSWMHPSTTLAVFRRSWWGGEIALEFHNPRA